MAIATHEAGQSKRIKMLEEKIKQLGSMYAKKV
jgi:hypothetical protein